MLIVMLINCYVICRDASQKTESGQENQNIIQFGLKMCKISTGKKTEFRFKTENWHLCIWIFPTRHQVMRLVIQDRPICFVSSPERA